MEAKAKKAPKTTKQAVKSKSAMALMGKKSPTKRAKNPSASKKKSKELATDFVPVIDPAHQEGHQRMNLKKEYNKSTANKTHAKSLSVLENVSRADTIRRNEGPQRRIPNAGK